MTSSSAELDEVELSVKRCECDIIELLESAPGHQREKEVLLLREKENHLLAKGNFLREARNLQRREEILGVW